VNWSQKWNTTEDHSFHFLKVNWSQKWNASGDHSAGGEWGDIDGSDIKLHKCMQVAKFSTPAGNDTSPIFSGALGFGFWEITGSAHLKNDEGVVKDGQPSGEAIQAAQIGFQAVPKGDFTNANPCEELGRKRVFESIVH
jgi:hypothetical protein